MKNEESNKVIKKPYSDVSELTGSFNELYGETTERQKKRYNTAFENFKSMYGENVAYVVSSSGRVEVIGNHTDHNGGKVISCAISLDSLCFFLPTEDEKIELYSEGYGKITVSLNDDEEIKKGTSKALIKGVTVGLKNRGYAVGGFKGYMTSNVCGGAGISSSASFEVLIAEIMNFLYNDGKISQSEKAIVSQFSENEYFGKPCGLLDQTAIAFGGLKKLDFGKKGEIAVTDIKDDLSDYTLILINSGGTHENLTDEYASIPREMFAVAKAFGKERLIEIKKEEFFRDLPKYGKELTDRSVCRAIHFFEENERVDIAEKALNEKDYETFIGAVNGSGISSLCKLQNCFVGGLVEQPIIKALSISKPYLHGGANRVHGGGFAGSILNIVKNEYASRFIADMKRYYGDEAVIPLRVRSVGTKVL